MAEKDKKKRSGNKGSSGTGGNGGTDQEQPPERVPFDPLGSVPIPGADAVERSRKRLRGPAGSPPEQPEGQSQPPTQGKRRTIGTGRGPGDRSIQPRTDIKDTSRKSNWPPEKQIGPETPGTQDDQTPGQGPQGPQEPKGPNGKNGPKNPSSGK